MKMQAANLLLVMSSIVMVASGCTKSEVVKKDGPIAPATSSARTTNKEEIKGAAVKSEPSVTQLPRETPVQESPKLDLLTPIPNAGELKVALEQIYFDFDASTLSPQARNTLVKNADIMKKDSAVHVVITGNCDERGSDEYNLALGERRAKAAMQYLMTIGVPEKRLSVISYGKEKPAVDGHDETAWAKNRRDEFVITSK